MIGSNRRAVRQALGKGPARLLCGVSISALVLIGAPSAAQAADRYWDGNGASPGGGNTAGNWNTTSQVWSETNNDVLGLYHSWNNDPLNPDNAIFGITGTPNPAPTITVTEPITVHNMTFQTVHWWTLDGGTLTLAGTNPTITTHGRTTINSNIAGTAGLVKAGGEILYLNGANTFSGGITINGGWISAEDNSALGALTNNIVTAASSDVGFELRSGTTSRTITIGNNGHLRLSGAGAGSARITGDGRVQVNPGVIMSNTASTYTGTTQFLGCNGVCEVYFTSIGNLGEASSLGAPTTVANGTITFSQASQYSDSVIYTGDGDSSNRNWSINTNNAALIRNRGTGTLTITGDVASTGAGTVVFSAEDADFELLGVLSGGNYSFSGNAGRSITLGNANTFTGDVGITNITLHVPTLVDAGVVSTLGTGSGITLASSTLSYTGAGATSSNRTWTINGAGGIRNDGGGALTLNGNLAFNAANPNPDSLRLGGTFAGTNSFAGAISGTGNLIMDGSGTWVLGGANTHTGSVTVQNGTLRAGSAAAFGTNTGFTVNSGTLDLNGIDFATATLNGTGGTVALGTGTLTVNGSTNSSYAGSITGDGTLPGDGGLTKIGTGTLTLTGASSYTGDTTVGGGTLKLDFSAAGSLNSNILSPDSTLVMSGGTLNIVGSGETNSQDFDGLRIVAGNNTIDVDSLSGATVNVDLGLITRDGGLINFNTPTSGHIHTDSTSLGGWATVNGSDYAKVTAEGYIVAFDETDYTDQDDASLWASGQYISDSDGDGDSFFGTVGSSIQLSGLQFTTPDATTTVTVAAGQTLGVDGTILVAPSVLTNNQTITGGNLTGAVGGGVVGVLQNGGGTFTIASTITDNAGDVIGFTKGGSGTVRLSGANTYTGVTTLSSGRLEIMSLADGGLASSIGASSQASSNLVLEGGTLAYMGGSDAITNRGFTLVNGGTGAPNIEVNASRTVEFTGLVTSPDNQGLTKTGWGTLVLSNPNNNYIGATTISGGSGSTISTISVATLANGGLASTIGASSAASSNLVLHDGGRLRYTGGTIAIDRGFTLGGFGGRIDVADVGTILTMSGTAVGGGWLTKEGAGTLELCGTNTYSGGTTVAAGTLRACSTQAFGTGENVMDVMAGATLDLNDLNNTVYRLQGAGLVDLGSATLTLNGYWGHEFTGTITGTGGITRTGGGVTQRMIGCNNNYTGVTTLNGGNLGTDCIADGGLASGIGASSADPANLVIMNSGIFVYTGTTDATTNRGFTLQSNWGYVQVDDAATTLTFTGNVQGAGHLSKRGAGTLVITNTSYTGATWVEAGILRVGSETAFDQGTHYLSLSNVAGATFDVNDFDVNFAYLVNGGPLSGGIDLGSSGTGSLTISGGSTTQTFAGPITGNGSFIKAGHANYTQILTNCTSDYTGSTTITSGTLQVSCLSDGGTDSTIGASTADAANLIINGGTLEYVGTGGQTDRLFSLGSSTASRIEASGTGAIVFDNLGPIAFLTPNTAQTITLGGTSTANNSLAALITDNGTGQTSLTKDEPGTWILTNPANTYTGVTRIQGGVLGVDVLANGGVASSIGMSSNAAANLVIGTGGTLRYTGDGDVTDRQFTLGTGTTAIQSSGSGAIEFTNTADISYTGTGARVVSLGGTNTGDNIMGAAIGNQNASNLTSLAKNDAGKWILTGNNLYTGVTNINAGMLVLGNGGATGSVASQTINNLGILGFNRSDTYTYTGVISQTGSVQQLGTGTTILTGTNTYTGGTTIAQGTLQLGNGGATGSIVGNVLNNGTLTFNRNNSYTFAGLISGTGNVTQIGTGTTILTANNTYSGGTTISAGTLQLGNGGGTGSIVGDITNNAALAFNRSNTLTLAGVISGTGVVNQNGTGTTVFTGENSYTGLTTISAGTLQIGDGGTTGSMVGDVLNNSNLVFNRSNTLTYAGDVSGTGTLQQIGTGTTILTGTNTYTGGTTISDGTLQIGDGGSTGSITGNVLNNGTLAFDRDTITFAGQISGIGNVNQVGTGTTILTGLNSYTGTTNVLAGTLLINGDQSAATGPTMVALDATLGGTGIIGGNVTIANGGILAPGESPGTLTINGNLTLNSSSILQMEFGEANVVGGPLNDLIEVTGDLVLDGTINVTIPAGGTFGPGIYRVINYDGNLTNNGLALGTMPVGSEVSVVTGIANQVNLVNTAGLTLNYWDGDAGPKFNGVINGGNGTWQNSDGNDNWTTSSGALNAAYTDGAFAIFSATPGTVTVDNSLGAVTASGMQFASNGYVITGDVLTLVGTDAEIRVGDGSVGDSAYAATISAEVAGSSVLEKTGAGTLVLSGTNSYTGGTAINAGTLQISSDGNLGDGLSGLSFDGGTLRTTATFSSDRSVDMAGAGTFLTDAATSLTLTGVISGAGAVTKEGAGTLILTDANSYSGGTTISDGTLQIGNGGTTGSIVGDVVNNAELAFDRSNSYTFAGLISGTGSVEQMGSGTTILTAANSYTGGTTISGGTLQLGAGGTTGSIVGDVTNNGTLAFDRLDEVTFAGLISGTGGVNQIGSGTTILTMANTYGGATNVNAGTLLINGDQSGAIGLTTVASAATLGGVGIIGGDVTVLDGGFIEPGSNGVGILTIDGNLSLADGALLNYEFGQADTVGGPLNDLIEVTGDLALDGTINVAVTTGGSFDIGVYRVINYTGVLTDSTLDVGTMPPGAVVTVQTAVDGQVNLVNSGGLELNFWDGDAGPKANGDVDGGNGSWDLEATDDNWTDETGSFNNVYQNDSFAIFQGTGGTVTVNNSFGQVGASGMQFAVDNYVIAGGPLTLVGPQSLIRVGDGTVAGGAYEAAISAVLQGATQLVKGDLGTLVLSGANTYTGGTLIDQGTLQISSDANLGTGGGLEFNDGTLHTTATTGSSRAVTINDSGTFLTDAATTLTLNGAITGAGSLTKDGAGTLILTGNNSYAAGTTIAAGTLQLGNGGTSGSITGDIDNDGLLVFNRSDTLSLAGVISGAGAVSQVGSGVTILTGDNAYLGATTVSAGTLLINGNQSFAFGPTNVGAGATLGGTGIIGGDVTLAGGILAPGSLGVGTLTIGGNLSLDSASTLAFEFGEANVVGGLLNDLVEVDGNLLLDGTINVTVPAGGSFNPGIYRVINYDGVLTDNGLALGTMPAGSDVVVQTAILGQVNLVNSAGLNLNFWDGDVGPKYDLEVNGGDGTWHLGGTDNNWTDSQGQVNAAYADGAFAIFTGAAGTVTVDNDQGQVTASGMQFATDGYLITGEAITLVGADALIRVGSDAEGDADLVATVAAQLTGSSRLVKADAGTLILTGDNSYTGGTLVNAGDLIINGDQSLATGVTQVMGGTLGGTGIIGGDVEIADGGTLAPGESPGTLTIVGDLTLVEGSVLDFEFGDAYVVGGPLNDLIEVGGDLVLDGTLNVTESAGGNFGPGIYRVINYGGALTDNGLELGLLPAGSDAFVQTSVAGQVNLVNLADLTLNFWDGDLGPQFNDAVNGGDGSWQSSLGNDNWTDADGALNAPYENGIFAIFTAEPGTVTVDNSLGNVTSGGMQFAVDGYEITGDVLTLVGSEAIIRVGDGTDEGEDFVATIGTELAGASQLVKTDAGTLVLSGTNSYAGGTAINGGTVRIASDANLGAAAGDLSFDGGTLHTTASIATARDAAFAGTGTFLVDTGTTLTLNGVMSGSGDLVKAGAGTVVLTADSSTYAGDAWVIGGTAVVNGTLGGTMNLASGTRLEGTGTVGTTDHNAGSVIAPGNGGFGTLTVNGGYAGGGVLEMEVELGDDTSSTDRLVVTGATSGTTLVSVTNMDGLGAATSEGIKIVDVTGASNGTFLLDGDYVFEGQEALIVGAYGYVLEKNGIANASDGDWYLRSNLADEPEQPIYQPGVPVYESYPQTMLALNGLSTLRQRIGYRTWAPSASTGGAAIWGRIEGASLRPEAKLSSSLVDADIDRWKMQAGIEHAVQQADSGSLFLGVTAHYGQANAEIGSLFGTGDIDTKGYGFGATLTFMGNAGFYADGQMQFSWYDSDLRSDTLGSLAENNDGKGHAFSIELGKAFAAASGLTLTPQVQTVYSKVDFDGFVDPADASVSADKGKSLRSRLGLSLDHNGANSHLYAIANLHYEWLDGTRTNVSGARIANRDQRLWGELGVGGSVDWGNVSLFGEASASTSLTGFGDGYALSGSAGVRIRF